MTIFYETHPPFVNHPYGKKLKLSMELPLQPQANWESEINQMDSVKIFILRGIYFRLSATLGRGVDTNARRISRLVEKMFFGIAAALTLGITPSGATACESVPRTTLALYDSTREGTPRDTRIHRFAEIILNHLGQRLVYHDVSQGVVPAVEPGTVGMILSWLDEPADGVANVWSWIAEQDGFCDGMPKIVAFGETGIGPGIDPEIAGLIGGAMGIENGKTTYGIGINISVSKKDNDFIDFEADFVAESGEYQGIRARPDGQTMLQISNRIVDLDLAVFGPSGGYLHASAAVDGDGRGGAFWIVDPFAFFGHVLGTAQWPIPDPTTLAGKRVFFATITGEGWLDVMPARAFGEVAQLASEVLVEKLIEPFSDLPITVGILTGDLEVSLGGSTAERGRQAAERALSRPNVEGGTEGYSDIRDWDFFASYDQSREAKILERSDDENQQGGLVGSAVQTLGSAFANTGASTFSRTPDAPRKYAMAPFALGKEVGGSLDEIHSLSGKKAEKDVFLWGGNARPFEAALVAVEEAGVENIGGGGGVYYAGYTSLTGLWPFAAQVGEHLQIYDALSSDGAYTGYWTTPLYGFYGLEETVKRTEDPRRLKPFHLIFSAHSAIFYDIRRAAERHFETARTADVIPIHATQYAGMVRGFHTMQVVAESEGAWRILDRGALHTVRFDGAGERVLDLGQSEGVLGARRKDESLYVSLDPGAESPLVVLAEGSEATGMALATEAPALVSSRVPIEFWSRTECSVEAGVAGIGGGQLDLVGKPGASYRVIGTGTEPSSEEVVTADAEGRMSVYIVIGDQGVGGVKILGPCDAGGA